MLFLAATLVTWTLEAGALRPGLGGDDRAVPVGSLQKPFVAMAWARSHPGETPPVLVCDRGSGCWRPAGHGRSGLARATALSCNGYFRQLASTVPADVLEATLREAGFAVSGPVSPDGAIGAPPPGEPPVTIRPSALLAAYLGLTREPWAKGETQRSQLLAGLREAASSGTAAGIGSRGFWAKTGTVAALDGRALSTSGWALAVDDSGWAILGLLPYGTGREAARALAEPIARLRPWAARRGAELRSPTARSGLVRVSLFGALRPKTLLARNLGGTPAPSSRGFVGNGASVALRDGDRLGDALWELSIPERRFTRRIRGRLASEGADGALRLVAELAPIEYVAGVLLGELPRADDDRRVALGAAVLRFLERGARHGTVDVCDTTHCAWFVGRGPRLAWASPVRPVVLAGERAEPGAAAETLASEMWERIQAAARQPGPSQWTAHCGGDSLSAYAVWGTGEREAARCPRHGQAPSAPWTRSWRDADLTRAFGAPVTAMAVADRDGVRTLRLEQGGATRELRYDEAHRRLAEALGWDALPSPARSIRRVAGGFEAEGVGSGHRVGLCLGD